MDSLLKDALAWTDLGLPGTSGNVLWWPWPDGLVAFWLSNLNLNPTSSPVFQGELISLAKQCDLPVRKVERWFRRRRNTDRPSLSKKFCEAWWAGAQAVSCKGLLLALSLASILLPPACLHSSTERFLSLLCLIWFFCGSAAAYQFLNCSLLLPFIFTPRLLLLLSHFMLYRMPVFDFVRLTLCFETW